MAEIPLPFRFPDELIDEGLAKCETREQAEQLALAIARLEALATFLMMKPRPRRRRWWRRR